jgi:type I restriction enzyme M protein
VTRALREFTEEHIQNIATIVRLYRGETKRLTSLLKRYKQEASGFEKQAAAQRQRVEKLKKIGPGNEKEVKRWEKEVEEAETEYKYLCDKKMYYEGHMQWLQERFPNGVYEDVIGLCKAATLAEIEEQDWSMNPGRYVGVVTEEDGLTEKEFLAEIKERHEALNSFNTQAMDLAKLINNNLKMLQ